MCCQAIHAKTSKFCSTPHPCGSARPATMTVVLSIRSWSNHSAARISVIRTRKRIYAGPTRPPPSPFLTHPTSRRSQLQRVEELKWH
ncbi:hypothetical protein CALCODRAFT_516932, partial [Calocera cornea HHB12733]